MRYRLDNLKSTSFCVLDLSYCDSISITKSLRMRESINNTFHVNFNFKAFITSLSTTEVIDHQSIDTFFHSLLRRIEDILDRLASSTHTGIHVYIKHTTTW